VTGNMAPIRHPITLQQWPHNVQVFLLLIWRGSHMLVTRPTTHNLLEWETNIRNSRDSDYEDFCGPVYDTV
jgi:hypothetical protein